MRVPLVNMAWEQALAMWGQYGMNADEHRRRTLTRTFHSSSVRADMAASKFLAAQVVDCDKQDFKDGYSFFFSYVLTSSLLPGFLLDRAAQRRGGGGIRGGGVSAAVLHLARHR